ETREPVESPRSDTLPPTPEPPTSLNTPTAELPPLGGPPLQSARSAMTEVKERTSKANTIRRMDELLVGRSQGCESDSRTPISLEIGRWREQQECAHPIIILSCKSQLLRRLAPRSLRRRYGPDD